jgi:mannosyltransferase PIG-V
MQTESRQESAALPLWVRGADALAVAFLIVGLFVLLLGGFILHLGPITLRVHSPGRLLFVCLGVAAIRHAAWPHVPLHRRVIGWLRAGTDAAPGAIARRALVSRIGVLLVGYFAVVTVGLAASPDAGITGGPLANLPGRFDAGWYTSIALRGYSFEGRFDRQQNLAFFPAFPMLERAAGYVLGAFAPAVPEERRIARLLWAGVIVSLIAFAWASVYLWRLARDTIGEDRAAAAVSLLAAYPFAVFFSAAYSESLFLLGCVATVYHFRRGQPGVAAAWGLLVGLTRPNGCFLALVLGLLLIERLRSREIGRSPDLARWLLAAAAPVAGMLIYSAYVHHVTGAWFGWARLHEAWGRSYGGLAPVTRAYGWITDEGLLQVVENIPYDTLNSLGFLFAVAMVWPVWRRLGLAYAAFIAINVVPPMLAGGVLSMGRISATLFPMFLALAAMASPRLVNPLVTAFAIGQGLAAVLFFTWRPLF